MSGALHSVAPLLPPKYKAVILVWPNSVPAFTHGSLWSLFFPGVTVLFFKNMNQIVYIYTVEILY